jgi:hypothetical protein
MLSPYSLPAIQEHQIEYQWQEIKMVNKSGAT